ncbi:MAG: PEP-CTERM sorting domain-containing protein [Planctomycetes bacterium]|nr:PEP-CTERM sorting domain-containing protein [Planctomycetota bacterium]
MATMFCAVIVLGLLAAAPAGADTTPVVDGRFDLGEGYTMGAAVRFEVEAGKPKKGEAPPPAGSNEVGGGLLAWYQDSATGALSVAFVLPRSLVDNSYGVNAIGWGKDVAPSGKNHNFQDLLGSDDVQFVFRDTSGNTLLDFTIDYLYVPDGGDPAFAADEIGGDGSVDVGNASDILAAGSSLAYNYGLYGASNPELFGDGTYSPAADADYIVTDPALAGWVFDVTYEFTIAGSVFAGNDFDPTGAAAINVPLLHASPNKIDRNKVFPTIEDPTPIENPEPSTIAALISMGLMGLAIAWRRRKRASS